MTKRLLTLLILLVYGCSSISLGNCEIIVYDNFATCENMLQKNNITHNPIGSISTDVNGVINCCWLQETFNNKTGWSKVVDCYGFLEYEERIVQYGYNLTTDFFDCKSQQGTFIK